MPDRALPPGMGRRATLIAALGLATGAAPLPVPASGEIAFRMIRHGSEIGHHTLRFVSSGTNLQVEITVDALVTLISIPVVRYTHRATETWQDGTLIALHAETNKNGDHESMQAARQGNALMVTGTKAPRYAAPADALPTSYWNKRQLAVPMISLEDGKLLHPSVADRGPADLRTAAGATIRTTHFNLSGDFDVDVFYDGSDAWAGFAVTVADGSEIHYERL